MKNIFFLLFLFLSTIVKAESSIHLPEYGAASWREPVATSAALPALNNHSGDCRVTKNTDFLYCWSGSAWVLVGGGGGGGSPGGSNTQFQYNNAGSFGGVPTVVYSGGHPYSTGLFGFNQSSPAYPIDAASTVSSISPPATVTVTSTYVDPSIIGTCNNGFTTDPVFQYFNDTTNCTANGFCYDGSTPVPGDTDQTTCTNDGFQWYFNNFTPVSPTAPYSPPPANDTVINYVLNSFHSSPDFYSATSTTGSFTAEFDTNPASFNAVQNEAESGFVSNGTTYNWIIYSLSALGTRTQGTTVTATDNNDGQPFAWDLTWSPPTNPAGTPPGGYLVYNQTTGNAAIAATESITDDNSWAPFSDPGIANVRYNVSWSAAAGASSYHINGPLGNFAFYTFGLTFADYGDPYPNNSSANPKGPMISVPGLHNNGTTFLQNTITDNATDATLKVWAPTGSVCGYAQQWFNGAGSLEAYIDCTGTFIGNFNPISGNLVISGTLTAGTVSVGSGGLVSNNGNSSLNWQPNSGTNNFFRVPNGTATTQMETHPGILFFDENVSSGTPVNGFGGGFVFRDQTTTTAQTQSAGIYGGWATAANATYAGEMRECLFDHNNTSTPICFMDATSNGSGVITTTFPNGDVGITKLGSTLHIASGANGCTGQATLSGGTVTVSTTCTPATSDGIFVTDAGGTVTNLGSVYVGTVTSSTSFVINSSNILDASKVNWLIVKH